MFRFDYHRATSLEDARATFDAAEDGVFLAGGMTLIPTLKQRLAMPSDLVDLAGVEALRGITLEADHVEIGAMVPHGDVAKSQAVRDAIPALAILAGDIGDPMVRARGTLGGSVANNDPAADYPGAVLGLGATIQTDRREILADDFFTAMFETALEDGELITSIRFPRPERAAYVKFHNPASRYAIAGVFVAQLGEKVRVAVTGAGPTVFRHREMEQALERTFAPDALEGIAVDAGPLNSDMHASADFRAHLVKVMAVRAVVQALK
ncbi:carbon monoxide dehydrogenase [Iodidimonas gelatinilytica]|uniref:Carbon monoxide dehydrogenase n=1 Tax=Iodidimonas gelatinilytica TaxID=1236966 RepID=A0A5A7MY23_9PROT|nr:xanthine dehydrogenase family protein subunit M [Iodidimonas gelatinilytica]GEQ99898.1 carbon monoxide dehydrogenase [Iodidimonas gelatinilytica]